MSAEDCRTDEQIREEHLQIRFSGRRYASRLADWLDNTDGLQGSVCCVEYGREEDCSIDMQVPRNMPASECADIVNDAVRMFCLRNDIEDKIVQAV